MHPIPNLYPCYNRNESFNKEIQFICTIIIWRRYNVLIICADMKHFPLMFSRDENFRYDFRKKEVFLNLFIIDYKDDPFNEVSCKRLL